ncbi:MAG: hypothetical protein ABS46_18855 [Cytophagaceae bacterium SCN 52-12]|nr:MAG: hypothetical protein ABS46_18855 [Cytophagaceae bacterium SCN 52-12]
MLKFVLTVTGLLIAYPVISQEISFTYDEAGNRIRRFAERALPVRLVSFAAITEEASVTLTWTTAGEEKFSHFELERSPDGSDWTRITQVPGRQSVERLSVPTYRYIDPDPVPGRNIYRLKMVDTDGTVAYSKLESVFLHLEVRVYPNPAKDYLLVDYPSPEEALYEVFAPDGRVVVRGRLTRKSRIDLGAISPALYVIRLVLDSGQTFTRRIIKE